MRKRTACSTFLLVAFTLGSVLAETLQPYDRLARGNVTLVANVVSAGSTTEQQTWKTSYGSYAKDMVNSKTVQVDVTLAKPEDPPITMEAFVFIKSRGGSRVKYSPAEVKPTEKPGSYTFDMSVKYSKERWVYADYGRVTESGDKVVGWAVRAIANNKIVGIAYSSESYRGVAGDPTGLSKYELAAPDKNGQD